MSLLVLTADNVRMPKGKLRNFVTDSHKLETRPAAEVAPRLSPLKPIMAMFSLVQDDAEETARLVAMGAGRVSGAAAPVARRVKNRQTVFASATVPQHNHFIKQCAQVCNREA